MNLSFDHFALATAPTALFAVTLGALLRQRSLVIPALVFALGGLLSFLLSALMTRIVDGGGEFATEGEATLARAASDAMFGAALPEEAGRFIVLVAIYACVRRLRKPSSIVLCGGLIALGFAAVENAFYALTSSEAVESLMRMIPTLSHGFDGLIMAAFLARSTLATSRRWLFVGLAMLVPVLLHFLFDFGQFSAEVFGPRIENIDPAAEATAATAALLLFALILMMSPIIVWLVEAVAAVLIIRWIRRELRSTSVTQPDRFGLDMANMTKALLLLLVLSLPTVCVAQTSTEPPQVAREFRGVWVATVANIDWPSKPGLPVEQQKAELIAILDKSAELNLNAVVFQVRPAADALYASKLEPWSAFLTGEQGKAPEPFYDPLEFAVEEAHKRGLELHAWFNPYRALHPSAQGELAETHLSKTHPEYVKKYGRYLWMDPGEKGVQDHSLAVVMDIVKRYDVDGVHLDDYFYPYKEKGEDGNILDFPDEPSYTRYKESGGTLARDDWRRNNVDTFIRRLYEETKAAKPWVQVGLSPFGIWRPGNPPQIQGFDAYAELYADSRKWLQEGWCDYFTPQLYWPVGQTAQDYPTLQGWWIEQNVKGRHIWPGLFTSRVGDPGRNWDADVIKQQILATRAVEGATGNIHFSMKAIMQERPGLVPLLKELYAGPALVPASSWLDESRPAKPQAKFDASSRTLQLVATSDEPVARWVVQMQSGDKWTTQIVPATHGEGEDLLRDGKKLTSRPVRYSSGSVKISKGATTVRAIAVDRYGNASEAAVISELE